MSTAKQHVNSMLINNLTFFVKHSILDVWQNSKHASVICYSLFGNIEDTNKFDLVAIEIY